MINEIRNAYAVSSIPARIVVDAEGLKGINVDGTEIDYGDSEPGKVIIVEERTRGFITTVMQLKERFN